MTEAEGADFGGRHRVTARGGLGTGRKKRESVPDTIPKRNEKTGNEIIVVGKTGWVVRA